MGKGDGDGGDRNKVRARVLLSSCHIAGEKQVLQHMLSSCTDKLLCRGIRSRRYIDC